VYECGLCGYKSRDVAKIREHMRVVHRGNG
jgi:hypothetical protein